MAGEAIVRLAVNMVTNEAHWCVFHDGKFYPFGASEFDGECAGFAAREINNGCNYWDVAAEEYRLVEQA